MSDKFANILDRAPSEITAPTPLPPGTYLTIIQGLPRYDKSTKKQTDYVEFIHKFSSPADDVDADDLKAALTNEKTGETKSLGDITMKNTYYITEASAWRLKKFLEDCGFDTDSDEHSLRELCESTSNSEVYVTVKHRPSDDGKRIFAEISDTARVG